MHQQLVRAVEQCGVPASEAQITYENLLQSEQIVIKSASLTDDQLRCVAEIRSVLPFPIIFFENGAVSRRYHELEEQASREASRKWLSERGLLSSLPEYDPSTEKLSDFARKLEDFCGLEPGTTLELYGDRLLTLKSTWVQARLHAPSPNSDEGKFTCLLSAIEASNLHEHGVRFGFVGNEYVPDETKP